MKKYFISILIFLFISLYGKAQQGTFDSWSIGVNAGLYGVGIQGATSLLPNLKLRAGYDYFNFTQQNVAEFEVDVEYSGYNATASAELSEMELTLPNFKVMLDYYPVENGIFALTAGLYFGQNKATTNGLIRDYQQLSSQLGTTDGGFARLRGGGGISTIPCNLANPVFYDVAVRRGVECRM
jgi:hypothetical protein